MVGRPTNRRRAIAFAIACVFVACGMLAGHHLAEVAHVRDAQTGESMHGLEIECHEGAPSPHLHGVPEHDDAGACSLADALHQVVRLPQLGAGASPSVASVVVAPAPHIAVVTTDVLLTAPKTSPPSHA